MHTCRYGHLLLSASICNLHHDIVLSFLLIQRGKHSLAGLLIFHRKIPTYWRCRVWSLHHPIVHTNVIANLEMDTFHTIFPHEIACLKVTAEGIIWNSSFPWENHTQSLQFLLINTVKVFALGHCEVVLPVSGDPWNTQDGGVTIIKWSQCTKNNIALMMKTRVEGAASDVQHFPETLGSSALCYVLTGQNWLVATLMGLSMPKWSLNRFLGPPRLGFMRAKETIRNWIWEVRAPYYSVATNHSKIFISAYYI